ncbi:MAG TPA: hypothetical protein VLG76_04165 [Rhabdochlamydiaceae bacterium]|nr:hypothetical protein [Rhabdochlamydiaceae bacterium]
MITLLLSIGLSFSSCPSKSDDQFVLKTSDRLHFGRLWDQIRDLHDEDLLLSTILKRRKEIAAIKEHWRSKVDNFKSGYDAPFYEKIENSIKEGTLAASKEGFGAAYFLFDQQKNPCFVIKPIDEDILCLNNRKYYASPYNDYRFRVRLDIPLYRSAQAEALSYAVAQEIGLSHMTPKTIISIVKSENFFDISDLLTGMEKELFLQEAGYPDKEKLCSIQEYIPNMKELFELVHDWIDRDLSDEEIQNSINQNDFEDVMILIWTTYDTDAHAGNIHVKADSQNLVYSLQKFDNGLTFPNKNKHLFNSLSFIPNALHPFSLAAQQKIRDIPISKIVELMEDYEMQDSIGAFLERMEILQLLNARKEITIYEIDLRLHALELRKGKEIALSDISIAELEEKLFEDKQTKKKINHRGTEGTE